MSGDDVASVRVAVRVRPLLGHEKVEKCDECLNVVEGEPQLVMGVDRCFTYDYVFSKYAQQSEMWVAVSPMVEAAFEGYNATIFAYGQTGSGKTYTMGSGSNLTVLEEERGIIPRVIFYMFEQIEKKKRENPLYNAQLAVRFMEIYGEEIRDLLDPLAGRVEDNKVMIREGENGEVLVTGAKEESVESAEHFMRLLEKGSLCRTTGSTLMNAHSSRSHAIMTLLIKQTVPVDDNPAESGGTGETEVRETSFNFVDLAGSERQKRTQAEGLRLKEGIEINKGLLALGNVISALGDEKKRGRVHVPYRDSKLTRMLQDSLGGNSRTLMITCVSPADVNFEETLNALKYANRARNIRNKPIVNRDAGSAVIAELKRQVQMLQAELLKVKGLQGKDGAAFLKSLDCAPPSASEGSASEMISLRLRSEQAEQEVQRLTTDIKQVRSQMSQLSESLVLAQAERDYYKLKLEDQIKSLTGGAETKDESKGGITASSSTATETVEGADNQHSGSLQGESSSPQAEANSSQSSVPDQNNQEAAPSVVLTISDTVRKSEVISLVSEHLRTIEELKAKLKQTESERDQALLKSQYLPPALTARSDTSQTTSILARAKRAIKQEAQVLQQTAVSTAGPSIDTDAISKLPSSSADNHALRSDADGCGSLDSENPGSLLDSARSVTSIESTYLDEEEDIETLSAREAHADEDTVMLREEGLNEAEEVERRRMFQHRQQQLGASVVDLTTSIALKEQLVFELEKTQKQYDVMKEFYEQKLQQMNEEVHRVSQDREKLLQEINQHDEKETDSKKSAQVQTLKDKLKEKDQQLADLKKKQKEFEKYSKMKQKTEVQMRQLYTEISNLKKQRVEVLRRMEAEKKKYQQEAQERRKEIMELRRDKASIQNKLRILGGQLEAQDRVLRRRIEEVTAANKRLRQQSSAVMTKEELKKKRWLDTQIKKLADRQTKAEKLEHELSKRESIVKRMEDLYAKRKKIQDGTNTPPNNNNHNVSATSQPASIREVLGAGTERSRPLTREEEITLQELEERIESCEEQLKYKDEKISEIANDVGDELTDNSAKTIQKISNSSLPEARTLLKILFDMVVQVKAQESVHTEQLSQLKQREADLHFSNQESSDKIQQLKMQYDQRLTQLQKEQEEKISLYMSFYTQHSESQQLGGDLPSDSVGPPATPARGSSPPKQPPTPLSAEQLVDQMSKERSRLAQQRIESLESTNADLARKMNEILEKRKADREELMETRRKVDQLEKELTKTRERLHDKELSGPFHPSSKGNAPSSLPSSPRKAAPSHISISHRLGPSNQSLAHRFLSPQHRATQSLANAEPQTPNLSGDGGGDTGRSQGDAFVVGSVHIDGTKSQHAAAHPTGSQEAPETYTTSKGSGIGAPSIAEGEKEAPEMPNLDSTAEGVRLMSLSDRMHPNGDDDFHFMDESLDGHGPHDSESEDMDSASSGWLRVGESNSIFDRLANPKNFTGMHKQRLKDSQRKKEEIREQIERARAKRLRDRGRDSSPDVQRSRSVGATRRSSDSAIPQEALDLAAAISSVAHAQEEEAMAASEDHGVTSPDGKEGGKDVYTRLALQYTVSAEKRMRSKDEIKQVPKNESGRIIGWDLSGKPIGWETLPTSTSTSAGPTQVAPAVRGHKAKPAFHVPIGPAATRKILDSAENEKLARESPEHDRHDKEKHISRAQGEVLIHQGPAPTHRRSLSHNDANRASSAGRDVLSDVVSPSKDEAMSGKDVTADISELLDLDDKEDGMAETSVSTAALES